MDRKKRRKNRFGALRLFMQSIKARGARKEKMLRAFDSFCSKS